MSSYIKNMTCCYESKPDFIVFSYKEFKGTNFFKHNKTMVYKYHGLLRIIYFISKKNF